MIRREGENLIWTCCPVTQKQQRMRKVNSMFNKLFKNPVLVALFALMVCVSMAHAQTDITGVVSEVSGYWDAVKVLAIAILLFLIGRKVVRKLG